MSVCVYVLYFLSHCMQPEGLWQWLAAALTDSAPIFPPLKTHKDPDPIPNDMSVTPGLPDLLPPMAARQRKSRTRTRKRKEKKRKEKAGSQHSYSPVSIPSPSAGRHTLLLRLDLRAALFRPFLSGRGLIHGSLRGRGPSLPAWGGVDLQPLADRRASLLAAQASARAPWAPPQFVHFAAPCGHRWPSHYVGASSSGVGQGY